MIHLMLSWRELGDQRGRTFWVPVHAGALGYCTG